MIRIVCLHIFFNLFLLTLPFLRLIMFGGSSEEVRKSSESSESSGATHEYSRGVWPPSFGHSLARVRIGCAYIKNCDKASETSEEPQIASFLSVRGASEKRPWCVRGAHFLPNYRDRDMRLDHSWRKYLKKVTWGVDSKSAGRMRDECWRFTLKKQRKKRKRIGKEAKGDKLI